MRSTRRSTTRPLGRVLVGAVAAGVALLPGMASAHIEPDPAAVQAGTAATVGFTVEHGCDGSPTVELRFQMPDGVTDAQPVAKEGWTTAIEGRVVSFTGGPLDATTAGSFEIAFTAPAAAGTIYFPVVQRCETGELPWIAIPDSGVTEPDSPAPAIKVTDGPPTVDDLAGNGHEGGDGGVHQGHHSADGSTDAGASSDGGVNGGLVAAGIGAVVIVGGAAVLLRRRRDTTG